MKKIILLLVALLTQFGLAQTTSWTGNTNANWNKASNWTAGVPTSSIDAIIGDANFTGSFQPNVNATAACKSLTIGNAGIASTLTISKNITVSGTVTIGANGTIAHSGSNTTITLKGNWINNGAYSATPATAGVTFSGTSQVLSSATTFKKLTVNTGSTLSLAANVIVNSSLSLSGTLDPASFVISGTGSTSVNSGGSLLIKAATFAGNHTMSGTITINGAGTVNYASSAIDQTISNALTYGYLRISGGTTKTLAGNLPSLSSSGSASGRIYIDAGTLDLQSFTANRGAGGGGAFTMAAGTTLKIGGTNSFPSNYGTVSLAATSTVEYNGTNQTILTTTYGNLSFSSSSGAAVKTMPGAAFTIAGNFTSAAGLGTGVSFTAGNKITVNKDVNLDAATTFNGGSFIHIFKGNWTNDGTFTGSTSSVTFSGVSAVLSGTGANNFYHLAFSGAGITAAATTTLTANGNLSSSGSGTFTHATGGVVNLTGTAKTISGNGLVLYNCIIGGTYTTASNINIWGDLTVNGSLSASAGTITMQGASKNFGGSGTFTFYALNILGTLTTANSFTMLSNLSVAVNGSFLQSAGTATFNGSSVLSGTANLVNVTINAAKTLRLGTNSFLGIANVFTKTGTLNITTSVPNTVRYNGAGAQSVINTSYHNLVLAGGGTKTAAGNITVNFDLTINSGVTFDPGSYTFNLYRHFTNNGSFTASTSVVQLLGSNAATITGATTFNSLIENKSLAALIVTLASSISTSTLTLTNGNMETGTNTVTITGTRSGNGIITGIITHDHSFTSGTAYSFEGPRNLLTFTSPSAGLTSVTVKVTPHEVTDFNLALECIMREYEVIIPGGTYTNATLRMHYLDNELNAFDEPYLSEYKFNSGTNWDSIGFTSRSTVNNYVEETGITTIEGRWTLSGVRNIVRWNGLVSNAWETAANWTTISGSNMSNRVPTSTDAAQIGHDVFTNQPILGSAQTVNVLRYGSVQSSTLTLTNGSLTTIGSVQGYWTANATHLMDVASYTLNIGTNLILSDGTAGHDISLKIGTGSVSVTNDIIQRGNSEINFVGNGTLSTNGNYNYTSGNFLAGTGTMIYTGSEAQTVGAVTYNNLSFTKSTDRATINFKATVNGNLSTSVGGEIAIYDTLSVAGDLTIGASTNLIEMGTRINVGGSFINSGLFSTNQGSINFNGVNDQNVNANTFNTLMINKPSGTLALIGDLIVNSDLLLSSGTLDLGTYLANRSNPGGNFTLASGATLKVGGANNFPVNYINNTLDAAGMVEYNGTIAQTVAELSYGHLSFSNGSALAKSLAGNIQVNGNFLINSGATFNPDSSSVTLYGNYTNNGTYSPSVNSTLILNGVSKTFAGTSTLYNLYVIAGSYTVTSGSVSMAGDLVVDATGSLNFGSNSASLDGDLTNRGSLVSNGSATFTGNRTQTLQLINAITSSSTGVVNFNGSVSPVLFSTSPPAFANVNINNTGGVTASVPWSVYFNFTVGAGATFNGGALSHTFYGNFTNNGTVTSSGDLTFRPGAPYSASGTVRLDGTSLTSTGNVNFAGTAPLTILLNNPSLYDVNVTNTNGVGVTIPSCTIGHDLYVAAASLLNGGSSTLDVVGNLTNNGTIAGGTSTFLFSGNPVVHNGAGISNFNHLTIGVGADVSLNKSIAVSGDLVVDGNFNALGRIITFNGSSAATISGAAGSLTLEDVVQNKVGSTITLAIPVTLVGDLTLTDGIINTTAANLLTLADDATTGTGNATSYVEGPMKKIGDDAFVFPLGKAGVWARLGISAPLLSTDAFTAEYFASPYSNTGSMAAVPMPALNRVSQVEYWTCDRSAGASAVTVQLFWEDVTRSDISDFSDVVVAHWNGTAWENQGQTAVTASDPGDVTSSLQTSFSPFTFGSLNGNNYLPITLLNFNAKPNAKKQVDLTWETATETNNNLFTVERSQDGVDFEIVTSVKGAGNSMVKSSYSALDASPYSGISYYRLKQTDNNGSYTYSGIRTVEIAKGTGDMDIYPNPNTGASFTMSFKENVGEEIQVVLVNAMGEEMFSRLISNASEALVAAVDLDGKLAPGIYSVIVTAQSNTYKKKLVIR